MGTAETGAPRARVQVLLSTYNGAAHLRPLLKSVIGQSHRPLRVLVRDDGSTDSTREIVAGYADTAEVPITMLRGGNLGPTQSFFALLRESDPQADYVAFCDQDDVWERDKLARALERLSAEEPDRPLLYCSRLRLVDADLRPLGLSRVPKRPLSLGNALVENVVTGCTAVLDRRARDLLAEARPKTPPHHDWWAYLVVAGLGRVVYDDVPSLLHRQHPANHTGMPLGLDLWGRRLRAFLEGPRRGLRDAQARELYELYGGRLAARERERLERFLDRRGSLARRLGYALRPEVYRQSAIDGVITRFMLTADLL